jgi:hypothetical protein
MQQWHNPKMANLELILHMSSKILKLHLTTMASRGMFQTTSVMVLLDVTVIFFRSVVVLTPNGNFWTVVLLHSMSDIIGFLDTVHHLALETEHSV